MATALHAIVRVGGCGRELSFVVCNSDIVSFECIGRSLGCISSMQALLGTMQRPEQDEGEPEHLLEGGRTRSNSHLPGLYLEMNIVVITLQAYRRIGEYNLVIP